jgi:SlyX protein
MEATGKPHPHDLIDENRLVSLETRLAYQEHTLQQLSDVMASQQRQLDRMMSELRAIRDRLVGLGESFVAAGTEEGPPPHY